MARDRYQITDKNLPHFLTCTVVNWIPVFTRPGTVESIINSFRYLQNNGEITVYGFVIMENHLHLIASGEDLSKQIGRFKSYTARSIIDFLKEHNESHILKQMREAKLPHKKDRDYQLWQEGLHPVLMQNEKIMRQKLDYMHNNPVRKGYVDDPTHWLYSSAKNYAGQDGLLEVRLDW